METDSCVENSLKRGAASQLSDLFYRDYLAALGGGEDFAAMVLDDRGEVLFCGSEEASILGIAPGELVGMHLSEIVPGIRLSAWSPGSNVAYASFIGRRNQWREYSVLGPTGQTHSLELLLDVVVVNLRYLILLWVRMPASRDGSMERSNTWQLPVSGTSGFGATASRLP